MKTVSGAVIRSPLKTVHRTAFRALRTLRSGMARHNQYDPHCPKSLSRTAGFCYNGRDNPAQARKACLSVILSAGRGHGIVIRRRMADVNYRSQRRNSMDLYNPILVTALIAWALAQFSKTVIHWIIHRQFDVHRLFGDGGMPSSHSAIVTSAATAIGLRHGWPSPLFALSVILALIVMHDAAGVRQETGKQARAINDIAELLKSMNRGVLTQVEALEEFVGHTGRQVFVGALLGILVALIAHGFLP